MAEPVPTLSSKGWLFGAPEKADYLLAYFFISDYSQTYSHLGNIKSLPYLIQAATGDLASLPQMVESSLKNLLSPYFDSVTVKCSYTNFDDVNTSKLELKVVSTVTQDGKTYSLGKLVSYLNSKFLSLKNITA